MCLKNLYLSLAMLLMIASASAKDNCIQNQCPPKSCSTWCKTKEKQMNSGYNEAYGYDIKCGWDVYVTGSFVYWESLEEGLNFAHTTTTQSAGVPFIPLPFDNLEAIDIDCKYKPGFKVGLGFTSEYDNWDLYAEYSRYHPTNTRTVTPPPGGRLFIGTWFDNRNTISAAGQPQEALHVFAKWDLKMDLIDFELARAYYVGKILSFRPYVGIRTGWIDQNLTLDVNVAPTDVLRTLVTKSTSWALGARAGIDTNWMLGCGFRAIGNTAASLLYTKYKVSKDEEAIRTDIGPTAVTFRDTFRYLRPNVEFALGLGWGTYFSDKAWHFDLGATYDFYAFWNQNIMRYATDISKLAIEPSPGNLYMHGLTITARLDF